MHYAAYIKTKDGYAACELPDSLLEMVERVKFRETLIDADRIVSAIVPEINKYGPTLIFVTILFRGGEVDQFTVATNRASCILQHDALVAIVRSGAAPASEAICACVLD